MDVAIGSLTGREVSEVDDLSQELWRSRIAGKVYPDARRLVAAHHRAGHTVAMASSATRFQAADAARDLDIEHVLVTELEDDEGILTGQVRGPILWGPGKAQAVVDFAAANGVDLAESYAYGNGREDVPYLETVGRPAPAQPRRRAHHRGRVPRLAGAPAAARQPADARHRGQHRRLDGRARASASAPGSSPDWSTRTGVRRSPSPPPSPPSSRSPRPGSSSTSSARRTSGATVPRSSSSTTRASSTCRCSGRCCAATSPPSPRRSSPPTRSSRRWAGWPTWRTSTAPTAARRARPSPPPSTPSGPAPRS